MLTEQGKHVQLPPYNGWFFNPSSLFLLNMSGNWCWDTWMNHPSVNFNMTRRCWRGHPMLMESYREEPSMAPIRFSWGDRCPGYQVTSSVTVVFVMGIPTYRLSQHFVLHLNPSSEITPHPPSSRRCLLAGDGNAMAGDGVACHCQVMLLPVLVVAGFPMESPIVTFPEVKKHWEKMTITTINQVKNGWRCPLTSRGVPIRQFCWGARYYQRRNSVSTHSQICWSAICQSVDCRSPKISKMSNWQIDRLTDSRSVDKEADITICDRWLAWYNTSHRLSCQFIRMNFNNYIAFLGSLHLRFADTNSHYNTLSNSACHRVWEEMAMMSVPAWQPPQNQGDAAGAHTNSAENGARRGAIAVQAVLASIQANANDAAQDISAPPAEIGGGYDGLAVISPVQGSQDRCHCCRHCCHCHRCHCCWRCHCRQGFSRRCHVAIAVIFVLAATAAVATTATIVAAVVTALLLLLPPPLPPQPPLLSLSLLLLPPLPQLPPPQPPSSLPSLLLPSLPLPLPPL